MKNVFLVTACALSFLFSSSCRKGNDPIHDTNPLSGSDQVSEYHQSYYDGLLDAHVAFPFIKKYDASGKTVTEIDCSFDDDVSPNAFYTDIYHEFMVTQKGKTVYLVNKALPQTGIPDTVARVTLGAGGRPEYCSVNSELARDFPLGGNTIVQHYVYRNNMVIAVQNVYTNPEYPNKTDSLHYDQHGNLLSFNNNSFQYDYTKTAKQQFYVHGLTQQEEPFYLLQYLGYFPEVNSPVNLMIHYTDFIEDVAITGHTFDGKGRLTGYTTRYPFGPATITWK